MVRLSNLKFWYQSKGVRTEVFSGLDYEFEGNNIHVIIGPSGVGKSTLLRLVQGLEVPAEGDLAIDGPDDDAVGGYLPQSDLLLPWKTAAGNLELARELPLWMSRSERSFSEAVSQALEIAGFGNDASLYPSQLSGGMRRRLALARSVLMAKGYLLLDEPFNGIDYILKLKIADRLHDFVKNRSVLCIAVMHDLEDALAIGDLVIVMSGRPATLSLAVDVRNTNLASSIPSERRRSPSFAKMIDALVDALSTREAAL